jgi:TonB family protein
MTVSLILLAALAALVLLRRRSAAVRHSVLAAAIGCAAAAPLLEQFAPAWQMAATSSSAVIALRDGVTSALPAAVPLRHTERDPLTDARRLVRPLWLAGCAASVLGLVIGLMRLRRLASRSRAPEHGRWDALVHAIADAHGPRRPITLLQSPHPSLLVTWGVIRPRIVLPAAARTWSDDRLSVVFSHELAHIRRADWAVQMAAELLRCVYWFNPLVWIVCARLRCESERACDDAVISQGVDGADYATHLVGVARSLKGSQVSVPALAMARPSNLEHRITAMLNDHVNRAPVTRPAFIAIMVTVLGIAVPIAGFGAGQSGTATFSGALLDPIGKVLPNAALVLTGVHSGATLDARSDASGRFSLEGVPAGDYVVKGEVPGLESDERVTLRAGAHLEHDVTLQLGHVVELINVSDRPMDSSRPARARRTAPPAPSPCAQSSLGGCIDPPMKLKDVKPSYPQGLSDSRTEGTVIMEGRIGTDGLLKRLRLIDPADPAFAASALAAVSAWEFQPTRVDGVVMETTIQVTVKFTIAQ